MVTTNSPVRIQNILNGNNGQESKGWMKYWRNYTTVAEDPRSGDGLGIIALSHLAALSTSHRSNVAATSSSAKTITLLHHDNPDAATHTLAIANMQPCGVKGTPSRGLRALLPTLKWSLEAVLVMIIALSRPSIIWPSLWHAARLIWGQEFDSPFSCSLCFLTRSQTGELLEVLNIVSSLFENPSDAVMRCNFPVLIH
jgi:hypothetical protein